MLPTDIRWCADRMGLVFGSNLGERYKHDQHEHTNGEIRAQESVRQAGFLACGDECVMEGTAYAQSVKGWVGST